MAEMPPLPEVRTQIVRLSGRTLPGRPRSPAGLYEMTWIYMPQFGVAFLATMRRAE